MAEGYIDTGFYKSGDSIYIPSIGGVFSGFKTSDTVVRMMIPLSKLVSSGVTANVWGNFLVRCGINSVSINVPQNSPITGTISPSGIVIDLTDGVTAIGTELVCSVGTLGLTINFS